MSQLKIIICALIGCVFLFATCSKSGPTADVCASVSTSFAANVSPIFVSSCAISGCHDAASTNVGGPFTTHAQIFAKRTTIRSQVVSGIMPQTGTLSTDQKNKIICWIDAGAPNN